ncbi:uncharacterized protein LOC105696456 [Orussus abietinus]|uniref:uncharacterized protein LOC105696456 n=1 Tax=Orussus abietinus TaxID=222816 RepID=UPI0006257B32|nr:uncharacterized protein LOC105696456 [Orussus abietinus]XP_012274345.1 uncharacterized protein LOC105696456 [Orussus abietinus]XP_012274346.1 uncharacterized protein LOC105696456 [Orussus abietinus]
MTPRGRRLVSQEWIGIILLLIGNVATETTTVSSQGGKESPRSEVPEKRKLDLEESPLVRKVNDSKSSWEIEEWSEEVKFQNRPGGNSSYESEEGPEERDRLSKVKAEESTSDHRGQGQERLPKDFRNQAGIEEGFGGSTVDPTLESHEALNAQRRLRDYNPDKDHEEDIDEETPKALFFEELPTGTSLPILGEVLEERNKSRGDNGTGVAPTAGKNPPEGKVENNGKEEKRDTKIPKNDEVEEKLGRIRTKNLEDLDVDPSREALEDALKEKADRNAVSLVNDTLVNYNSQESDHGGSENSTKGPGGEDEAKDVNKVYDPKKEFEVVANASLPSTLRFVAKNLDNVTEEDAKSNSSRGVDSTLNGDESSNRADLEQEVGNLDISGKEVEGADKKVDEKALGSVPKDAPKGRTISFSAGNEYLEGKTTPSRKDADRNAEEATDKSFPKKTILPEKTAEQKPYPYVKFPAQSPTTQPTTLPRMEPVVNPIQEVKQDPVVEESTEEASAFENTIGRQSSDEKFVVTEPSVVLENSIQQMKPASSKRSGNLSRFQDSTLNATSTTSVFVATTPGSLVEQTASDEAASSGTGVGSTASSGSDGLEVTAGGNDVGRRSDDKTEETSHIDVTGNGITEESASTSSTDPRGTKSLPGENGNSTEGPSKEVDTARATSNVTPETSLKNASESNAEESGLSVSLPGTTSSENLTTLGATSERSTVPEEEIQKSQEKEQSDGTDSPGTKEDEESSTLASTTVEYEFVALTEANPRNSISTSGNEDPGIDAKNSTVANEGEKPSDAILENGSSAASSENPSPSMNSSESSLVTGELQPDGTNDVTGTGNSTLKSQEEGALGDETSFTRGVLSYSENETSDVGAANFSSFGPSSSNFGTTASSLNVNSSGSSTPRMSGTSEVTDFSTLPNFSNSSSSSESLPVGNSSSAVVVGNATSSSIVPEDTMGSSSATTEMSSSRRNDFTSGGNATVLSGSSTSTTTTTAGPSSSPTSPTAPTSLDNVDDRTRPDNSQGIEIVTKGNDERIYPAGNGDAPFFVRIVLEGTWADVCPQLPALRKSLAELLTSGMEKMVAPAQIVFHHTQCGDVLTFTSSSLASDMPTTSVLSYVVDEDGNFDPIMTKLLPSLHKVSPISFPLAVHSFLLVQESDSGNAIAVVVVSCVAFICLALLAGLLFIMRKRQTRFNYGERCRPVSLDAYSLDSVSAYNSVRRKGATRASKRSYGNPTFEDSSVIPTHPLNFGGLSTFCNDVNAISEEFKGIPQESARIDELPTGAEVKNRYANVIPLPETRVPLQKINNDPLSEYINASYVRGPKNATKYYIACQAPLESTVTDFWRMIWEQQSKVIIMLTDLVENGVEKCAEYVPPSEVTDCHRLYGDFQVTLKKRETKEKYAISSLHLKNLENNTFREVSHIWYMWPANGTLSDGAGLIAVLLEARALQRGGPGPIVIHCSPGTGRTGTLIALDLAIRQYEITRTVDVPRVVYTIRRDRAGAVQTKEQYAFVYKALYLYATKLAGGALESM